MWHAKWDPSIESQAPSPECPVCGADLVRREYSSPTGLAYEWACSDGTCPTLIPDHHARALAARGDVLGAPVEDLMRSPVSPRSGGGNGGSGRRTEKPGEREARLRIRRSHCWDGSLTIPDQRDGSIGCDRLTSSVHSVRLTSQERSRLRRLAQTYGSESEAMRAALEALEALEEARGEGRGGEGARGVDPFSGGRGVSGGAVLPADERSG
jgi:hypothetical protein